MVHGAVACHVTRGHAAGVCSCGVEPIAPPGGGCSPEHELQVDHVVHYRQHIVSADTTWGRELDNLLKLAHYLCSDTCRGRVTTLIPPSAASPPARKNNGIKRLTWGPAAIFFRWESRRSAPDVAGKLESAPLQPAASGAAPPGWPHLLRRPSCTAKKSASRTCPRQGT